MEHLKQPPELDFSSEGNIAERWKKWRVVTELFLDCALSDNNEEEKCKCVLYIIGQEGRDIFKTFEISADDKDKINPLLNQFEKYCIPKRNITMERHKFNTRLQHQNETVDQYVTELKNISDNCEFGAIKNEIELYATLDQKR